MSGHQLNLPWYVEDRTIKDCNGVPVAVTLNYTSVRRVDADGTVYNTSEYAGPLRADLIVAAVNAGIGR
jgi:hypothetical protein